MELEYEMVKRSSPYALGIESLPQREDRPKAM
jgi:hypothetical protein